MVSERKALNLEQQPGITDICPWKSCFLTLRWDFHIFQDVDGNSSAMPLLPGPKTTGQGEPVVLSLERWFSFLQRCLGKTTPQTFLLE